VRADPRGLSQSKLERRREAYLGYLLYDLHAKDSEALYRSYLDENVISHNRTEPVPGIPRGRGSNPIAGTSAGTIGYSQYHQVRYRTVHILVRICPLDRILSMLGVEYLPYCILRTAPKDQHSAWRWTL
jgi:hypothetical protein